MDSEPTVQHKVVALAASLQIVSDELHLLWFPFGGEATCLQKEGSVVETKLDSNCLPFW